MIQFYPDYFKDEKKYCRALFIKKYPSSLSDRFLNEITSLPVHSITSIDVVPIPKDMTTKILQKKYLGIESDIIKQQRVRNKNNDFSSEISYNKRNSVTIEEYYLKQREALNTALPIGVRQVETMRTMLTQSLAVLMPFNVQELNDGSGCYYGINQVRISILETAKSSSMETDSCSVFRVPVSPSSARWKWEMYFWERMTRLSLSIR